MNCLFKILGILFVIGFLTSVAAADFDYDDNEFTEEHALDYLKDDGKCHSAGSFSVGWVWDSTTVLSNTTSSETYKAALMIYHDGITENGEHCEYMNKETAKKVGSLIAEKAKAMNIDNVVFDRNGYLYHGRVRSLAEGAREGGLNF